ncbi:MAG: sodium-dependent transporter [Simkaniaceae bacterium]
MAAAGSAIGLGSLWRFPYVAGDSGGGAFVLLYIIFTILIGLPVFIGELIIGRHTQKGAILSFAHFEKAGNWKFIGWLNLITCIIILSYYAVVSGWCLSYILMSISQFSTGKTPEEIRNVFDILVASPDINLFWLFFFLLLNFGVVFSGIRKGIEYWSRILTPALLFILVGMFIYSLFLSGFKEAAAFILLPDFSKITPTVVLNALGMSFFTLSVGLGIIVTYGSYMRRDEDIPKTGLIVTVMSLFVSLMAALTIFPIVFTYNFPAQGGVGLVFKTMPVIFANIPGSLVISTVFFTLFVFTALTSSISLLEVVVANFMEVFHMSRGKAVIKSCVGIFVIGIPSALSGANQLFPHWKDVYGKNFFDTMDYITASWMMPIAGLLTTIFIGWFLNKQFIRQEFEMGTTYKKIFHIWYWAVRYLAPFAVILIILQEAGILEVNKLISLIVKKS